MKRFFRSMFGRITIVYLAILVVVGVVIGQMAIHTQGEFVAEADQRLNANLAANLAAEFVPFIDGMPNYAGIEETIHNLMVYNPRIEIYVLDTTGTILSFFSDPETVVRESVDVNPIHLFLAGSERYPLLGDDPKEVAGLKPFSVSPIDLGNRDGYLYVILGGELVDTSLSLVSENYIVRFLIRGLLLVLGISAVIGVSLFFIHTRRFSRLTAAVDQFTHGDRSARVTLSGSDEIGVLSVAFNQMADDIQSSLDKLRETDRERRDQIANISHDLKTPLSSILGFVETIQLQQDRLSEEDRDRYLGVIRDNAQTVNRLISELSQLSTLETKAVEPNLEEFSLAELVQDVVMSFEPQAGKKILSLSADIQSDLCTVRADLGLIERVLSNLIRNAIQYTDAGGAIVINVTSRNGEINVSVTDTGCGIAPEEIPNVKQRFYRVDKSRSSGFAGMGLGLSISEMILNLHNSTLEIESQLLKGSSLSFSLQSAG